MKDKNESFSNKRINKLSEFTQKNMEKLNDPKFQGENWEVFVIPYKYHDGRFYRWSLSNTLELWKK